MYINLWIIKDADVDETLYLNLVNLLTNDSGEKDPKSKFNLVATKTLLKEEKGPISELDYCNRLRDELKILSSVKLIYLTNSIIDNKISDSDSNNNIVLSTIFDENETYDKKISFLLYLFVREILNFDNDLNSIQKDITANVQYTFEKNIIFKEASEQAAYIVSVFPGESKRIITLLEQLKTERNTNRSLTKTQIKEDIEILNLVIRLIKWIYRRPFNDKTDLIKIEITTKGTFTFYFSNDKQLDIKLEPKPAAFYAFFLLWCEAIEKNFNELRQDEIDIFRKIYTYYDRPYENNHRINIKFGFPNTIKLIAPEINKKLHRETSDIIGYEINDFFEYSYNVLKIESGYKVPFSKQSIHISESHKLIACIHPTNKAKIKIISPIINQI